MIENVALVPQPRKPEIFIIDDMPGEIDLLIAQLEDDYQIKVATEALDALERLQSLPLPDLILLDVIIVEPNLWTGVGRARSGCGAALVGSVDQILTKLERYQKMGIRAFIFSGYPHKDECENFGTKVLPQLQTCQLSKVYG